MRLKVDVEGKLLNVRAQEEKRKRNSISGVCIGLCIGKQKQWEHLKIGKQQVYMKNEIIKYGATECY